MKLSIVIPIYNEAKVIPELIRRIDKILKKHFHSFSQEVIFIDDGSVDESFETLRSQHKNKKYIKVIQFSRNFGHHNALTAGLEHATGNYIVMMDGDLQDKPEEIITLYKKLIQGFDIVYALRVNTSSSPFKHVLSFFFLTIYKKFIVDNTFVSNTSIFRIMRKDVVKAVLQLHEADRYIVGIIDWVGFKKTSVRVKRDVRYIGKSSYSFNKSFSLAINAFFSFSHIPLRSMFALSFFLYSCFVCLNILLHFGLLPKFFQFSLSLLLYILGGVVVILLFLVAEYSRRTYFLTKNRPLYIIKTKLF